MHALFWLLLLSDTRRSDLFIRLNYGKLHTGELRSFDAESHDIVIAHRLSTLSKMDRILVFDQGRIVEEGTHSELLGKEGFYARLWQMQAGGFLPDIPTA